MIKNLNFIKPQTPNRGTFRFYIGIFLHISFILVIISIFIFYIYESRELFKWRIYNISVPIYNKMRNERYFLSVIKMKLIDGNMLGIIYNSYKLQLDWTILLMILFFLIGIIYIYRYLRGQSLLYIRLAFIGLLILTFLFYFDPFFAPLIHHLDLYLKENITPNVLRGFSIETSSIYKSFQNSDFLQHIRLWLGYGDIYTTPKGFENITFHQYDFTKLDPNNTFGLNHLPHEQYAARFRQLANIDIFPDFLEVIHCMRDYDYYFNKYHITIYYYLPFLSPLENYSLSLSLISIVFMISIILSILYLLNYQTRIAHGEKGSREKLSSYECGFEPIHTDARMKFDILYWIIGILYLIFDLEIIFIFPLATILQNQVTPNPIILLVYLFFIIILTLGFIYEWKKGVQKMNG